jgi:hypothetical protein
MKTLTLLMFAAATFAAVAWSQPPRNSDRGRQPGPPPPPPADPIVELFDMDGDGVISKREIANAVAVLKKLDRDNDGELTREELPRPPRPEDRDRRGPGPNDRPAPRGNNGRRDQQSASAAPGTVLFSGGYETDRRDNGRPVALIAAALGVKTEVFRDAFSRVTPARGGEPSQAQVQANKQALLNTLGKYGITNDRLDTVSNYYRYRPGSGDLWRHTPATAKAIIKNGKVTGVTITNPGAGYMTAPTVTVAGHPDVKLKATIDFDKDVRKNGRLTLLTLVK